LERTVPGWDIGGGSSVDGVYTYTYETAGILTVTSASAMMPVA